jgi:hypothetical protein
MVIATAFPTIFFSIQAVEPAELMAIRLLLNVILTACRLKPSAEAEPSHSPVPL